MSDIRTVRSFHIDYCPNSRTNDIYVKALLEDRVLLRPATLEEPEEWGPALCETQIYIEECDEKLNLNENQLLDLLELSVCEWKLCED